MCRCIYTYAISYEDFGEIRVWVNFLYNLSTFIIYCWLMMCRYQTAKTKVIIKLLFLCVSCNTAIIIWSLLIPSFVTRSKSKHVESPVSWKKLISLFLQQIDAWTFYLIKKFFVSCCGDSLGISFLGENQSIHKYLAANEVRLCIDCN